MVNSLFFDTNVVLDIIDANRDRHEATLEMWEHLVAEGSEIFISEDMLSTIFYLNVDKKFALEFFQFIQTRWQIVPFGQKVIKDAVNLTLENSLDLEDVLQCLCAKENGCDVLITNDKKFYDCGIKIVTIEEFLS